MKLFSHIQKFIQHNWLASIYLNLKMLPFRQAIKLPIDVYHGIRFESLHGKIIIDSSDIHRGMIKIGSQGSDMFHRKGCIIYIEGTLILHGSCVFGCSDTIIVGKGAVLEIGNGSIFGAYNILFASERITIGSHFLSSWQCQLMDSDTHNLMDMNSGERYNSTFPIEIGCHCWMGNGVKVNKGVAVAGDTIMASNSLLNKDYRSEGSNVVLAGIPAKVVKRNVKWQL